MGFFIAMFLCNLLMPSIMVIAGYCMYKNPPKEINGLIGYRTAMSEKNKDTWAFAHDCCGKLWIKSGIILLVPTVLVQIPFAKSGEDVVGTVTLVIEAVQVLALIGSVILVEKALKRTFDEMATNADRVRDTAERRGGYMKADEVISRVVDLCREYDAKKVILYGSRAKGTAGERSDIDIAVSGVAEFDELLEKVEELPTLYSVDLLNMDTCRNDLLMEDIKQYGREI